VRRVVGGVIAAGLVTLLAGPSWAHASLVSAQPGPGDVVPAPLTQIVLEFDDPITDQSQVELVASSFQLQSGWTQTVDGSTLTLHLAQSPPPGTYTVTWMAASLDSHVTSGSYQFAIKVAADGPVLWPGLGLLVVGFLALALALVVWRRREEML
jgi:methionine-rich copper-binding protein CopC